MIWQWLQESLTKYEAYLRCILGTSCQMFDPRSRSSNLELMYQLDPLEKHQHVSFFLGEAMTGHTCCLMMTSAPIRAFWSCDLASVFSPVCTPEGKWQGWEIKSNGLTLIAIGLLFIRVTVPGYEFNKSTGKIYNQWILKMMYQLFHPEYYLFLKYKTVFLGSKHPKEIWFNYQNKMTAQMCLGKSDGSVARKFAEL